MGKVKTEIAPRRRNAARRRVISVLAPGETEESHAPGVRTGGTKKPKVFSASALTPLVSSAFQSYPIQLPVLVPRQDRVALALKVDDFVVVDRLSDSDELAPEPWIIRVVVVEEKTVRGTRFVRGQNTILGSASKPNVVYSLGVEIVVPLASCSHIADFAWNGLIYEHYGYKFVEKATPPTVAVAAQHGSCSYFRRDPVPEAPPSPDARRNDPIRWPELRRKTEGRACRGAFDGIQPHDVLLVDRVDTVKAHGRLLRRTTFERELVLEETETSIALDRLVQRECRVRFCPDATDEDVYKLRFAEDLTHVVRAPNPFADPSVFPIAKETEPLTIYEAFAGCGALGMGLESSGLGKVVWGFDIWEVAVRSLRANHPDATILQADVNDILRAIDADDAETLAQYGLKPQAERQPPGVLAGGPPCQGFSELNSFKNGDAAKANNALVASYLSLCDRLRPRFFILENVKSIHEAVVQRSVSALLEMDYQCCMGLLQAGSYGAPQSRTRFILLAAKRGEVLPDLPQPTHCFTERGVSKRLVLGSYGWRTNPKGGEAQPLPSVTVKDAIGDLGPCGEQKYRVDPQNDFQRSVRMGRQGETTFHDKRFMSDDVAARVAHVPRKRGADWRDIPNDEFTDRAGKKMPKLIYVDTSPEQMTKATGHGGVGHVNQQHTLIPYAQVHTGNSHNHYAGSYGRLHDDGYFETTMKLPMPTGKQGLCIMPHEDEVATVRVWARTQGFPDSLKLEGGEIERYNQIGNAVPFALSEALGREIKRAAAMFAARRVEQ